MGEGLGEWPTGAITQILAISNDRCGYTQDLANVLPDQDSSYGNCCLVRLVVMGYCRIPYFFCRIGFFERMLFTAPSRDATWRHCICVWANRPRAFPVTCRTHCSHLREMVEPRSRRGALRCLNSGYQAVQLWVGWGPQIGQNGGLNS